MRILFTCGGTAGHINPAVALARQFQSQHPQCQVLFVGAKGGMECRLVPKEGYELETVTIGPLRRSLTPKCIAQNFTTMVQLGKSFGQAKAILAQFKPDLVVGTGGYASYPVVRMAAKQGIPTAVHESNAVPGLTTKMLSKVVDTVMVGFADSRDHYPHPERVEVTGTPVRPAFFQYTRAEARTALGITDDRPLVLTYWGSLGAEVMNRYVVDMLDLEDQAGRPFHHIHGAGRNFAWMEEQLKDRGIALGNGLSVREYIYDMPLVMAAADLVLCRAGASTIAELTALAKPSILVPSPNVVNNHQEKNARVLERHGAGVVLLEPDASGQALFAQTKALLESQEERQKLSRNLAGLSVGDATQEIYQTLLSRIKQG